MHVRIFEIIIQNFRRLCKFQRVFLNELLLTLPNFPLEFLKMKEHLYKVLVLCCISYNVSFGQIGEQAPLFNFTDLEGNSWNLQNLMDEGFIVCLVMTHADNYESALEFDYQSELINNFYLERGPDGDNSIRMFFIDVNPLYGSDMIDGSHPAAFVDYTSLLNFPCIDANEDFLNAYGFIDWNPLSTYRIDICNNGQISDFSQGICCPQGVGLCEIQTDGIEAAVHIVPGQWCFVFDQIQLINEGSETITSLEYQILTDQQVIGLGTWEGELLPFNSVYDTVYFGDATEEVAIQLMIDDVYSYNNTSTVSVQNDVEIIESHIKMRVVNSSDQQALTNLLIAGDDIVGEYGNFHWNILPGDTSIRHVYFDLGCKSMEWYTFSDDYIHYELSEVHANGDETILFDSDINTTAPVLDIGFFAVSELTPFNLVGVVFHDLNGNGEMDSFEQGIGGVEVIKGSETTYTNSTGQFIYPNVLRSELDYLTISYDSSIWPNITTNDTLFLSEALISSLDDTTDWSDGTGIRSIKFGLSTNEPFYLLNATSWDPWFNCSFDGVVTFEVSNAGTIEADGTCTVVLDSNLTYTGASPDPVSFIGDTVVWNFNDLAPGSNIILNVYVISPSFELMGDTMNTVMTIVAYNSDGTETFNNSTVNSGIINCGYDPNDITGFPAGETEAHYIMNGTTLEYLIRFQNTGNYLAFDIRVDNQLSSNFDFSSFEFIGASHACVPVFNGETGFAQFYFDNINLPDSTTNLAASQGWLRYRVSPFNPLQELTTIENTASIYFDFNPPVITNTYLHTISDLFFGMDEKNESNILIYPNPNNGRMTLIAPEGFEVASVRLIDIYGNTVHSDYSRQKQINVSHLANGVYIVEISDGQVIYRTRVVMNQ
jgi:hypothetical protein